LRIAYFDCFAGASGDMILGALLDAGLDFEALKNELQKVHLHGYGLKVSKSVKKGITGTKFDVLLDGKPDTPLAAHNHGHVHHDHKHEHPHRNLKDISALIQESHLSDKIKKTSILIFTRLAEAEAKIHNKSVDEIHFHEVGAVDSIVDIVGAAIGLELLGIDQVVVSKIHVGTGTVECTHGTLPVPAPATMELLKDVPVYSKGIESELITPTGAAILTTLADHFGAMPAMKVDQTGYGAGFHDLPLANLLRVSIGESQDVVETDTIRMIETSIDDMNPQFYDHIMEKLFEAGAKDVFLNPIIMKKSRPGVILSVIVSANHVDACTNIIFRETTTLGVRLSEIKKRMILKREFVLVKTPWGEGKVKVRVLEDGSKTYEPEFADCKRFAQESDIPVQQVFDTMKNLAAKK